MGGLMLNKCLLVKEVYLMNTIEPLKDCIVWMAGDFVIIAQDENDTAPTWYNSRIVTKLKGAQVLREPPRTRLENQMRFI